MSRFWNRCVRQLVAAVRPSSRAAAASADPAAVLLFI